VFLDFRRNPDGFHFDKLEGEAREYLTRSGALLDTPIERLRAMNPGAVQLYGDHGIDLAAEPLEIAVCAQHNNGGLAGNLWWESTNIKHLFPIGEVNGSHGVTRPGGSALNAGQVGAFRAAEFIARRYAQWRISEATIRAAAARAAVGILSWIDRGRTAAKSWQDERAELQERMSRAGAHVRSRGELDTAVAEAWRQFERIERTGGGRADSDEMVEALRNRALCFAHAVYLDAARFAVASGVGSRGSAMVLDERGTPIHEKLGERWRIAPEDPAFREQVQETQPIAAGRIEHRWVPRRPIPEPDLWFETAWARFRSGEIYGA
jgi:succinate dehydrogenase/fumarate reductase flavoprotein subunit